MASEWIASAIKLAPKKADLHFQLGQVLEEQHYVQDLYGIKPSVRFIFVFVRGWGWFRRRRSHFLPFLLSPNLEFCFLWYFHHFSCDSAKLIKAELALTATKLYKLP